MGRMRGGGGIECMGGRNGRRKRGGGGKGRREKENGE